MSNPLDDSFVRKALVSSGFPDTNDTELLHDITLGGDAIESLLALRSYYRPKYNSEGELNDNDPSRYSHIQFTPDDARVLVRMLESPRFLAQCDKNHRAMYVQGSDDERLNLPAKIKKAIN
jgi:hypothetical protein